MQHSHEALDRPGGFSRAGLLLPLRHRDFRVLWAGMAVSLLGDGIFLIAVAWESYALWNTPAALSIVGIGMTVPTVVFLLIGGVLSDRLGRPDVFIAGGALGATALLAALPTMPGAALGLLVLGVLVGGPPGPVTSLLPRALAGISPVIEVNFRKVVSPEGTPASPCPTRSCLVLSRFLATAWWRAH